MSEYLEADANLAEIRRIQTELAGVRDELAQRDRAIVAAHRAIELARAELDAARAVVTLVRDQWIDYPELNAAVDAYDELTKAREG